MSTGFLYVRWKSDRALVRESALLHIHVKLDEFAAGSEPSPIPKARVLLLGVDGISVQPGPRDFIRTAAEMSEPEQSWGDETLLRIYDPVPAWAKRSAAAIILSRYPSP